MLRLVVCAVALALFANACSDGGGAQVRLAMPASARQALTGFDARAKALVTLEVVCDDGRGGTFEQELSARVETAAFFVPPCGQATLNLSITGVYSDQDPVLAFEATADAFLEGGKNSDVEFTGIAYGELVLDPLGQPLTLCTAQDVNGQYEPLSIDMTGGATITQRVPAGDYDVYCYDELSAFATYQPTRVNAGQRTGPDLSLPPPPVVIPGSLPVLRDLVFYSIKPDAVLVTFGFTTASIETIEFTVLIGLDPLFTELAQPAVTIRQGTLDVTGLTPDTHYYVRVTGTDKNGAANVLDGEFSTTPESLSSRLVNVLIDNVSITNFDPARQGYTYNASPTDAFLTFTATTEDVNAFVRIGSDPEVQHSAVAEVPIAVGRTDVFIYVRTYDSSSSRSYNIAVFK